ncbi:PH domain-containing protein [Balneolaceae bacterium ANBcel3]|nr:PH domain-containing protein [Balneolaceae bacterium ANBcel3]
MTPNTNSDIPAQVEPLKRDVEGVSGIPFSEPQRQHPAAILTTAAKMIKEMFFPLVVFLLAGRGSTVLVFLLLSPVFLLAIGFFNWLRYTWHIKDDEIRIHSGIFVRRKKYLHRDRIQAIDISSGVIQRIFGLVRVTFLTASGTGAEIQAIEAHKARAIEKELQLDTADRTSTPSEPAWPVYQLSAKRLLFAASTSASFGVALSIVGTLFSQLSQVLSTEEIAAFIEQYLFVPTGDLLFFFIFAAIAFAWLISVVGTILQFASFSLSRNGKELHIKRGLLEKKSITIPFHRVQAIRIVEGTLRQPFGFATVYLENAGLGDEGLKSTILHPLIRKSELNHFIKSYFPEYDTSIPCVTPPSRAFLRYQIKTDIPFLLLSILAAYFTSFWLIVPLVLIPAVLFATLQYLDAAAGFRGENGVFQYRSLAKNTFLFRRQRLQSLTVLANWFQRNRQLCSVSATVASGRDGVSYKVDHLNDSITAEWFEWYRRNPSVLEIKNAETTLPTWVSADEASPVSSTSTSQASP